MIRVIYLTFVDGDLCAIDTFPEISGRDLNATARELLREWRYEFDVEELRCAIYLLTGTRLAFAGEEVLGARNREN